jgi:hypothetical protein
MKKYRFLVITALYALLAEGLPIIFQFVFVILHNSFSTAHLFINESFMNSLGFYVFQIGGFYLTFIIFYLLLLQLRGQHLIKASFSFLIISIAIEAGFYLLNSIHFSFMPILFWINL